MHLFTCLRVLFGVFLLHYICLIISCMVVLQEQTIHVAFIIFLSCFNACCP